MSHDAAAAPTWSDRLQHWSLQRPGREKGLMVLLGPAAAAVGAGAGALTLGRDAPSALMAAGAAALGGLVAVLVVVRRGLPPADAAIRRLDVHELARVRRAVKRVIRRGRPVTMPDRLCAIAAEEIDRQSRMAPRWLIPSLVVLAVLMGAAGVLLVVRGEPWGAVPALLCSVFSAGLAWLNRVVRHRVRRAGTLLLAEDTPPGSTP